MEAIKLIRRLFTWEEEKVTCKFANYLMQMIMNLQKVCKILGGNKLDHFRGLLKAILTEIFSALSDTYRLSHT